MHALGLVVKEIEGGGLRRADHGLAVIDSGGVVPGRAEAGAIGQGVREELEARGEMIDIIKARIWHAAHERIGRSEERRVGKECRSRWSADHLKKKKKKYSRRV